ncbi:MAG TPA: SAM-dependent methyltransferase [Thermoleophilaceae bacterium]|jgi:SAM-dependent methyltransferase|nr:SAM-dependent methyltransferase [Thermoleophilaceae bacterium]
MSVIERSSGDGRLPASYFDRLYAGARDPWRFESSRYEQDKYAATLAALGPPERRFARAFEAGCSIGVFTRQLAARCDDLLAVDLSPLAVERARERLGGQPHVRVERRALPEELPEGPLDLVVCSEVLYYWTAELLSRAMDDLAGLIAPGGSLVAVHWRPQTRDYPQLGDAVHERLAEGLGAFAHSLSATEPQYRLDRWDRPA